jgi:hypothetical protein
MRTPASLTSKTQCGRQRDENEVVTMSEGRSAGFTAGSVPEAYDRFMAPQLFEPWAREMVGRAKLRSGSSVLDVASGPAPLGPVGSGRRA